MRSVRSLLLVLVGLLAPLAGVVHAETATKIADVDVKIDEALVKKATGIHTMFIVLYDAASTRPMPYGAIKVTLDKDAKGTFYKGALTTDNVMVMGGGDLPKTVRIKAKLNPQDNAGPTRRAI